MRKSTRILIDTGSLQRILSLQVEFALLAARMGNCVAAGKTVIDVYEDGEIIVTTQDSHRQIIEPAVKPSQRRRPA